MRKPREMNDGWVGAGHQQVEDFAHRVDCHGASMIGSKRAVNQDEYLIAPLVGPSDVGACCEEPTVMRSGPPLLFVVADGVGGAPAGERASSIAIRAVHRALTDRTGSFRLHDSEGVDPGNLLEDAVSLGQKAIEEEIDRHMEQDGMGTTLTAALVLWPKAHIVHVGDSRCYVVRRSSLEQITVDHTVAQRMAESGLGNPEARMSSRWRNVLWNVIGGSSPEVHPQVRTLDLRWGDALLLATDGLTDSLSQEDILQRVREEQTAEAVCASLIQAARERKGSDDMTVVYAQFGRSSFWRHLREIFLGG